MLDQRCSCAGDGLDYWLRSVLALSLMNRLLVVLVMILNLSRRVHCSLLPRRSRISMSSSSTSSSLEAFGLSSLNTLQSYLVPEPGEKDQFLPRQVLKAHYVRVKTEASLAPYLVIASESCARALGLSVEELRRSDFPLVFAGNRPVPGLDSCYCTNYGCHVYGSWFGQLGDGRCISLGEVMSGEEGQGQEQGQGQGQGQRRLELQLKGAGRSPFSRNFDGKAVLRSCIREFLASEAMHHLRVPSTRALSIVGSGAQVRRAWYVGATSEAMKTGSYEGRMSRPSGGGFPPDRMNVEPGAVMCRVSPSFIRVAQIELFAQRGEVAELVRLADLACHREFPHLLDRADCTNAAVDPKMALDADLKSPLVPPWSVGSPRRYVELFRCICEATSALVVDWLRVGYVQGNMNSDNILIGGRTLDFGPFAFMERYDPLFQPFTSDADGKFAFMRQASAMSVNMLTLAESIAVLVDAKSKEAGLAPAAASALQQELQSIAKNEFVSSFQTKFNEMRGMKLGLAAFGQQGEEDQALWRDLEMLMYKSGQAGGGVDYTIFFRELAKVAAGDGRADLDVGEALSVLQPSFYDRLPSSSESGEKDGATKAGPVVDVEGWKAWIARYQRRLARDDAHSPRDARVASMLLSNPKFSLRNWMMIQAYEAAEGGDYSLLHELHALLQRPYEEQGEEQEERWYRRTPDWARNMPGAAFLS